MSTATSLGRGQRLQKSADTSDPKPRGRLADLQNLMKNKKSKSSSKTTTNKEDPATGQFNEMVKKMRQQMELNDIVERESDVWTDLRKDAPDMKEGSYVIPGGVWTGYTLHLFIVCFLGIHKIFSVGKVIQKFKQKLYFI